VLPQTPLNGAQVVAEKLRKCVAATAMSTSAGLLNVTVSIGVSSLEALAKDEVVSVDALLDVADRCLYESKEHGRNCVTVPAS
jgi:two-component system, sensor histidine kinase LadS